MPHRINWHQVGAEPEQMWALSYDRLAVRLAVPLLPREEARRIAVRLCQHDPALRVCKIRDYIPHRRPEDIELFAEGLRRAGVPE